MLLVINESSKCQPFKRQPQKMVIYNQAIREQFADELFECVLPLCGVGASRVKSSWV